MKNLLVVAALVASFSACKPQPPKEADSIVVEGQSYKFSDLVSVAEIVVSTSVSPNSYNAANVLYHDAGATTAGSTSVLFRGRRRAPTALKEGGVEEDENLVFSAKRRPTVTVRWTADDAATISCSPNCEVYRKLPEWKGVKLTFEMR